MTPTTHRGKVIYTTVIALIMLGLLAANASADTGPASQHALALDPTQTVALLIGALVPLVTYVLNHHAPWASEHVKAVVLVIVSAVASGLYQSAEIGGVGLNAGTLQIVGGAVFAALSAHHLLWKPSGIAPRLGAGTNAPARGQAGYTTVEALLVVLLILVLLGGAVGPHGILVLAVVIFVVLLIL